MGLLRNCPEITFRFRESLGTRLRESVALPVLRDRLKDNPLAHDAEHQGDSRCILGVFAVRLKPKTDGENLRCRDRFPPSRCGFSRPSSYCRHGGLIQYRVPARVHHFDAVDFTGLRHAES